MSDTDDEWRFGIDEVGEDAGDDLTPGEINPENALFFLAGVAFAVGVVVLAAV